MCCIFTCCGWIIDLLQRVWTFAMSCCIMSAVGCVMVTTSMGGIALGYNYSLAEYIDLKETNVSVYLKRGVFDDEVADDMEWRRAGHLPVKGHLNEDNLRTAPDEDESTTIGSGRRLDDSMVDGDDQNKFEGSLMKLTAKPIFQDTTKPPITDDLEMASAITRYPDGSLDQLKAIQSVIDSRRAMAAKSWTSSPLATYASAASNLLYFPQKSSPNVPLDSQYPYRRMMGAGKPGQELPPLNPARLAVPDAGSLLSKFNWEAPKDPAMFMDPMREGEFLMSSPTFPPRITVFSGVIRPQTTSGVYQENAVKFSLNPDVFEKGLTTGAVTQTVQQRDRRPELYNEKVLGDLPRKNENIKMLPKTGGKPTEEEYEDEIKGLPVRRRRSIRKPYGINIVHPHSKIRSSNDDTLGSPKNIFPYTIQTSSNGIDSNNENNFTNDTTQSLDEVITDSQNSVQISNENNTNLYIDTSKRPKADENKVVTIRKLDINGNKKSLFNRLIALIQTKEARLAETTSKANSVAAKKTRMKRRRKSFENKIVSSKYEPSNIMKKLLQRKGSVSNQELVDSITVTLNEAPELLGEPASPFLKILLSTLTA